MTQQLHPDPEILNAFVEGALPEQERLECVAHCAECSRCREIIFLAQPQTAPSVVPIRRRWYSQPRAFMGAIAACLMIAALSLYRRPPTEPTAPSVTVQTEKPASQPPGLVLDESKLLVRSAKAQPEARRPALRQLLPAPKAGDVESAKIEPPAVAAPPPTLIGGVLGGAPLPQSTASPQPAQLSALPQAGRESKAQSNQTMAFALRGPQPTNITGTVKDPSGAAIPGAIVTAKAVGGSAVESVKTNSAGEFLIAGLPSGKYNMQFESPGFVKGSSQVDLKPNQDAVTDSTLAVGSQSQTVEIGKYAAKSIPVLRNNVSIGKRNLAIDPAGALSFSKDEGKHWKAIKPKWSGKVTQLEVITADSSPVFQLTTESGDLWTSPDGTHWHPQKN